MLVGFDPASGHEQQGAGRPALVLSVQAFNQLGMTLVAPITQGGNFARYAGFSVPLHCEEGDVHGVVLVNQVRMMDLRARLAKRIGLAADEVVEEALLRLQAVVEEGVGTVSYRHLRARGGPVRVGCRLLLAKKKRKHMTLLTRCRR